jgi:hypothetical protein
MASFWQSAVWPMVYAHKAQYSQGNSSLSGAGSGRAEDDILIVTVFLAGGSARALVKVMGSKLRNFAFFTVRFCGPSNQWHRGSIVEAE